MTSDISKQKRTPKIRPDPRDQIDARVEVKRLATIGALGIADGMRMMRLSVARDQEEFAKAFRLTRRQISEIERGVGNPTIRTLERVSRAYGLRLGFIPKKVDDPDRQEE